jgi:predicted dehydrogenase
VDYKDLLARDDIELVVNALPSHLHPEATIEALKAGHHVVCEKPLAATVKDFRRMAAAAKRAGRILAPYQQRRYDAAFQQIQKVIDSGVLGRIVMIKIAFSVYSRRWDWQTLQEFDGGNLLNKGPHALDQVLCLLGWKMPEIACRMDRANVYGDAEDHVKVLMWGKGLPTVDLEVSSCCAYPGDLYQISGTRGGLTGGLRGLRWRYFRSREAPKQELLRDPLPGPSYCRETLKWHEKVWEPPEGKRGWHNTPCAAFYRRLHKVLRHGAALDITPEQVGVQVAVMEECHRQNSLSKLTRKGWPEGN